MTIIDVHHHPTLTRLTNYQERVGRPIFAGAPAWTPEIALDQMAVTGTDLSVLSTPGDLSWVAPTDVQGLVNDLNDELHDIARDRPTRFGAFAVLPMPDPEASARTAISALDEGGFQGVTMLTSYQGAYLAQPEFEPLLQELDARSATVFMHPILVFNAPAGLPGPLLEGTFDTTRAVTALAGASVFARFPHIRFIFPHTGGMVPYIKWRIALYCVQKGDWNIDPTAAQIEEQIRRLDGLYYDTTLNLGPLLDLERTDRILFGTDIPWASTEILRQEGAYALDARAGWTEEQVRAVSSENALRILPHLAARLGVPQPGTPG
ncbi:amidohydrolase [Microbacterium lacus]|uniref:amidohydrolase family protein n=1 Tax=Microbacterium lacus TaxID=415217 RepID=UPI00384F4E0A